MTLTSDLTQQASILRTYEQSYKAVADAMLLSRDTKQLAPLFLAISRNLHKASTLLDVATEYIEQIAKEQRATEHIDTEESE